jgi:hypothetical protein
MFGRPSSPFARAVLPIAGGIVFFAALFGVTWLMATYVTNNTEVTTATGDRTFVVGEVEDIAKSIADRRSKGMAGVLRIPSRPNR